MPLRVILSVLSGGGFATAAGPFSLEPDPVTCTTPPPLLLPPLSSLIGWRALSCRLLSNDVPPLPGLGFRV